MPHECTNCGKVFADGSKEMLSGCPVCGGNKFQFRPATTSEKEEADNSRTNPADATSPAGDAAPDSRTRTSRPQSTSESSWPSVGSEMRDSSSADGAWSSTARRTPDVDAPETGDAPNGDESDGGEQPTAEDQAQASARTDVVSERELDAARGEPTAAAEAPSDDRPDLAELRDELNEQFESIKIVNPGQYELNLMELYDREEYIISLREDGRYIIEVPDRWGDDK